MTNQIEMVTDSNQYIVVVLGAEQYGIDISNVDNIVKMQKITRVPKSQGYFNGVINLRGEIVPVMSLRRKFKLENDEFNDKTRIIILKPELQDPIGVIVDMVKEVVTLKEEDIEKMSADTRDEMSKYLIGVGKNSESLISLLNIPAVISDGQ
ncbi:MAG: chemotaxis protein CheW [Lachnospiraceae bacterium]|nr:purine-binding chemotaxis protein CheW [Lachnospiraceae bacterium]MDE5781603.1 chemotaxis protein CheW [Lachnospiraceae bacterium]MDE6233015.1 chemotaxis protein CheW [Lachnospiraceae bacterium]MDE6253692.1 chemotaxis protein CheW [Lachnospiraceae bacterium]